MTLSTVVIALSYKVKGTHHYDTFPKGNISLNSFVNIILKPSKVLHVHSAAPGGTDFDHFWLHATTPEISGLITAKITCIRLHSIDEGRPKPSVVALFTLIFLLPIHYPLPSFPLVCRNSNWDVFSGRPVHLLIRCIYALKI